MVLLQAEFVGGGPLALVVTFLVATFFSAVTLHLAALWVLGDEPHQNAVKAAPVPVVIAMLFSRYSPALMAVFAFAGALTAVRYFAISTIFAFSFANLFL
ncbi:hypothetical protein BRD14_04195 [Halobacteriales archaeon SW_5_68_122]|nr:MAG: hypothetical protein BRD14_04195 [Halobacteriales archaeon SW_5_68_122]